MAYKVHNVRQAMSHIVNVKESQLTSVYDQEVEAIRKDVRSLISIFEECKRTGRPPDVTFTPGCGCKWVNSVRHEVCREHSEPEADKP